MMTARLRSQVCLACGAALALALGAPGVGCIGAEMEIPEISLTQSGLRFPGVPGNEDGGDVSLSTSFTGRTGKFQLSPSVQTEVSTSYALVTASSGTPDLGFIRTFRVTVEGTGAGSLPIAPAEVARYERVVSATPVGPTITAQHGAASNLFEHWKAKTLLFKVEIAGDLPPDAWGIDLSVRFSGIVRY